MLITRTTRTEVETVNCQKSWLTNNYYQPLIFQSFAWPPIIIIIVVVIMIEQNCLIRDSTLLTCSKLMNLFNNNQSHMEMFFS